MENTLGVLGGMGPLASQLFYKMVIEKTAAVKDQEHINMIILNHATMPDRTEAIFGENSKQVYDLLFEDCKMLEHAKCKAIVGICNTAHYFLHQYKDMLTIPILSMVREAAAEMGRLYRGERVAVLATDGTIKTALYQAALEEEGVIPYLPDSQTQRLVMRLIYDCVKRGAPTDKAALISIDDELKASGCKAALTACTELSVIKTAERLDGFYADPMEILAEKAIVFMGKKLR
ncbi:MAG: aspartate/glutamate racemase family protein [Clostridia bacterium]|nr:aspartate/glutamate racemase family protein [Clostridia bacterium]